MTDYEIGYGKPPKMSRFKPGVSGNPKGRRKRQLTPLAEIIRRVLSTPVQIQRRGRTKTTTYAELVLKGLIDRAMKGHLGAADLVLRVRAHAQKFGDAGVDWLEISDWLSDYPGQTADQKTEEFAASRDADPTNEKEAPQSQSRKKGTD
jgi:hypothetical protein